MNLSGTFPASGVLLLFMESNFEANNFESTRAKSSEGKPNHRKQFIWLVQKNFVLHMRGFSIEILVLERVCLRWSSKHFWQNKLVKSLLISTLDKVIYFKGTFLQHSTKPLFTTQNRLETS
jgi:hypothetical protein